MPKGIPLTPEEQARRRREIFAAAVHLFLEKGFNETSMREIAEAAGVGKSTLYDYFPTKDEILLSVVVEELNGLNQETEKILQQPASTVETLRRVILAYLNYLSDNEHFYMKLSLEVQRLAATSQARIQAKRHAYQNLIVGLIQRGIEEGCFRPVDAMLAARLILTAMSSAVYTTRPSGTREEMMDSAIDLVLNGLKA